MRLPCGEAANRPMVLISGMCGLLVRCAARIPATRAERGLRFGHAGDHPLASGGGPPCFGRAPGRDCDAPHAYERARLGGGRRRDGGAGAARGAGPEGTLMAYASWAEHV